MRGYLMVESGRGRGSGCKMRRDKLGLRGNILGVGGGVGLGGGTYCF